MINRYKDNGSIGMYGVESKEISVYCLEKKMKENS